MTVIAIDLGGTKVASALVAETGEIPSRRQQLLGNRTGSAVGALVAEECRALLAESKADGDRSPTAIGVIVPGIYRAERGTVWAPNIPGWDDYPLRAELEDVLAGELGVLVDSDRAGYILGESWCGAAQGARDAIFLAVGTGIGAGILVDGRVLRGHADIAGAIGWLALDRPFRSHYTACGCFESHASGPGLTNVARSMLEAAVHYDGELRRVPATEISTASLFAAYDRDDPIARRVLDDAIEYWGMATANLVSLFNPQTIVFGGGVFGPATRFLDRIATAAAQWAQPIAMRQVRLVASKLGSDAGLLGAARLALGNPNDAT